MRRIPRSAIPALCIALVAALTAACSDNKGSGSGTASAGVVLGTTDKPTSLDPAGAYDLPSWTLIYNIYQNLLKIAPGKTTPVPDAAKECSFTAPTTYQCTLTDGLTFSNGDPMTAKDVKASFERVLKINDPAGPPSLFANMKSIEAPDDKTVVMTLDHPDATWPFVLTTGAGAIVDSKVFPADAKLPNEKVIGSGPYKLTKYSAGQSAALERNDKYTGDDKLANSKFIVQYYDQASALKLAVEQGDVDVAYRNLSPTDLTALGQESNRGVKIVEGAGAEIRYMVFQLKQKPFDNPAVRKAIALTVDRAAIAKDVYDGTVDPLYSMVPVGLEGHTDAFKDAFGAAPDVAKAKTTLQQAGVATPVDMTLWWTPSHYGPNSADEYAEIKRQLEASGLFKVTLKSTEWTQYQSDFKSGIYPAWQLGWFPDFPDPDDYSAPFLDGKGGYFHNGYINPALTTLVAQEEGSTDTNVRDQALAAIQKATATDVPMLPLWQGKQVAAIRTGVTGVEDTFDPSFTFRFWLIGKNG
ncbi:ABC transporter substrate-binding protein [Rugosimonospora africana]|uniref:Peptide ABC transporter substrate-binding protein n=1 Tax=Rugosimonospora africana TaxID=556532 RepID=A0A8J3QWV4_9ACTN|nr:ABC transporter substrate-binding protein [Rugosimonospora africana]GIH16206.1 peptide ABC transporter substrate-binding protein [Rugosimonospora africana]